MQDIVHQDLSAARAIKMHASAQALLYDIQRRVQRGYVWWLRGELPVGKVLAVATKLGHRYGAFATPAQRSRRKGAGQVSAVLFVWPVRQDAAGYTTTFRFLLLSTGHLDGEVMFDGRQRPVRVDLYTDTSGNYHLRPATRGTGTTQKQGYAWHLTPKSAELLEQRLAWAAQQEWPRLERAISAYCCFPMTSGYRLQLRAALQAAAACWRRNNRPSVLERKSLIKQGVVGEPLKVRLPFIQGFPSLYDSPPITLQQYLAINDKRRKEIEQQRVRTLANEHVEVALW